MPSVPLLFTCSSLQAHRCKAGLSVTTLGKEERSRRRVPWATAIVLCISDSVKSFASRQRVVLGVETLQDAAQDDIRKQILNKKRKKNCKLFCTFSKKSPGRCPSCLRLRKQKVILLLREWLQPQARLLWVSQPRQESRT